MVLVAVFLEDVSQTVRLNLDDGGSVILGRHPEATEDCGVFQIPWLDRIVSRNHALIHRTGDQITLQRLPPLPGRVTPNGFYDLGPAGDRELLRDPVILEPGEGVCVGNRGQTALFWLAGEEDLAAHREELQQARRRVPSQPLSGPGSVKGGTNQVDELDEYSVRFQLQLLQQELPEKILLGWSDAEELMTKAAGFLQASLPGQRRVSAAFLAFDPPDYTGYHILNQDPSGTADFLVHPGLIERINRESPQAEDVYIWSAAARKKGGPDTVLLNQSAWVIVLPLAAMGEGREIFHDRQGRPVFLYVAARKAEGPAAKSLVPFVRLISSLVASLLSAREKQRIRDSFSAHFSPALRRLLEGGDPSALQPTLAECTVLFCDRRGTSRLMEKASSDEEVIALLRENQVIMTEISSTVFDHDGVITDFAGDGVLALWGWPVASTDHGLQAVQTAAAIAERLSPFVEDLPTGRKVACIRMGISTGRIAVGNTGPVQQVHLSVFGSAVNFGSRLEALAKQFRVPALLSDATCQLMRHSGQPVRKLCFLRPAGFDRSYPVYELVLPRHTGGSEAGPDEIAVYESALDRFVQRQWDGCIDLLSCLPGHDGPARWLRQQAAFFSRNDPGPGWQGEMVSQLK